ncbi:MAG: cell division protein FtsZ [Desulfovibrio sp.]|nr:cell division protein FtsZ [Desulfovibrio sp.]
MDDAEVLQTAEADGGYCLGARIKVIGIGGGGGNAVQHMIDSGLSGVQFVCANTDRQALNRSTAPIKLQLGEKLTRGRGAGANPKVGREAAQESINGIRDAIGDAEMLFVTAGMGGGTGTGGAAVVAQVAREMNVLTVGVVTKPFGFEGSRRMKVAEEGISELKQYVDCLITIPNDRLISLAPKKASFVDMMQRSNEVLYHAVKGISDVVNADGTINLDFEDLRTTMQEAGLALMGTGVSSGENRAREAAQKAISSPLLEDVSLDSAKAILYNITASRDISVAEVNEIGSMIKDASPAGCNIIFGVVFDDNIGDELSVTLIATGIEPQENLVVEPEEPLVAASPNPQTARVTEFKGNQGRDPDRTLPPDPNGLPRRRNSTDLGKYSNYSNYNFPRHDVNNTHYDEDTVPAYERRAQRPRAPHNPGTDDFLFEDDALELPTFIRHQAN